MFLLRLTAKCTSRKFLLCLARGLGNIFYVLRVRRNVVRKNLLQVFQDDIDEKQLKQKIRRVYKYGVMYFFDAIYFNECRLSKINDCVTINYQNAEELGKKRVDNDHPIFILSSHYCNPMALLKLGLNFGETHTMFKKQKNHILMNFLINLGKRFNTTFIFAGNNSKKEIYELYKTLQNNGVLLIAGDQSATKSNKYVPFFGTPVPVPQGIGRMVYKTESRLYFSYTIMNDDRTYSVFFEKPDLIETENQEDFTMDVIKKYHKFLEGVIRKDPCQYFWFHKRWKYLPNGEINKDFYR